MRFRTLLRRFAIVTVAICTFAGQAAMSQDAEGERLNALAMRLALNSTVLRLQIQQSASPQQQAQFKSLSETEVRLNSALREAKTERARRQQIEQQVREVTGERLKLVQVMASMRQDFAAELERINTQFSNDVKRASPAKRLALERFVAGEPDAYGEIERLTYTENEEARSDAITTSKRNLSELLELSLQNFLLRNSGSMDKVISVAKDLLRYDERNLEAIRWVILSMGLDMRDKEIVRFCNEISVGSADEIMRLNIAVMGLGARLDTQPYEVAELPVRDALLKLEAKSDGVNQVWGGNHWIVYCRAVLELAEKQHYLLANDSAVAVVQKCVTEFGDKRTNVSRMLSGLTSIGTYYLNRGNLTQTKRFQAIANEFVSSLMKMGAECPDCVTLGGWMRLQQMSFNSRILLADGYRQQSTEMTNERLAAYEKLVGRFGESPPLARELAFGKALIVSTQLSSRSVLQQASEALSKALAQYDLGEPPTEPGSKDGQWLGRVTGLGMLSMIQMRMERLQDAERTLDEAAGIIRAMQLLYPLGEPELTYARHPQVYSALMDVAIARSTLRRLKGESAQAERILRQVRTSLAGQLESPIYAGSFKNFDIAVDLQLAGIAAQAGRSSESVELLQAASTKVAALRDGGSETFDLQETDLEIRFRLAQIRGALSEVEAVRAEKRSLEAVGRSVFPQAPWVQDLEAWKPGRAIQWLPQPPGSS